jgi:SAM-dependent methyltransferase
MSGERGFGALPERAAGGIAGMMDGPLLVAPSPTVHEQIYRDAAGDASRVPWEDGRPNPFLVSWLNAEAPGLIRPGARVVVVGCGLGDDVRELTDRGYDAQGFDCAPTAVTWARERHAGLASQFVHADLFSLPAKYRHRFDLVVEVYTLQSVGPEQREAAARGLSSLVTPHGVVLAICRGRDDLAPLDEVQGPPFPLTPAEMLRLMEGAGLRPLRGVDDFTDDETPPQRRVRGVFVRA